MFYDRFLCRQLEALGSCPKSYQNPLGEASICETLFDAIFDTSWRPKRLRRAWAQPMGSPGKAGIVSNIVSKSPYMSLDIWDTGFVSLCELAQVVLWDPSLVSYERLATRMEIRVEPLGRDLGAAFCKPPVALAFGQILVMDRIELISSWHFASGHCRDEHHKIAEASSVT